MTGPEHYREAERLLSNAQGALELEIKRGDDARIGIALESVVAAAVVAQAHAALALVAATAAGQATTYDGDEGHSRSRGWAGVV